MDDRLFRLTWSTLATSVFVLFGAALLKIEVPDVFWGIPPAVLTVVSMALARSGRNGSTTPKAPDAPPRGFAPGDEDLTEAQFMVKYGESREAIFGVAADER